MDPKISIIIPIFNAEKYLNRCLDSVINQTLEDVEIICINDGSTDNSLYILQKFREKDKRIIILNQDNRGASAARNVGLKFAKGEFVGFIDADDTIEKNFYELLYNNAKKYEADIACGEVRRPDSKRKKDIKNLVYSKIKTGIKTTQKYKLCRIPERCFTVNKIYNRKNLLKSNIIFAEGYVYEDIYWSHVVLDKLGKLVVVPHAIYNYYWNYNNCSKSIGKNIVGGNKIFARFLAESIEYAFLNKIKIKNYKFYTPLIRIRVNILGIRFFDLRIWESVKVFYILGIEILRIYVNNNKK